MSDRLEPGFKTSNSPLPPQHCRVTGGIRQRQRLGRGARGDRQSECVQAGGGRRGGEDLRQRKGQAETTKAHEVSSIRHFEKQL